MLAHAGHGTRSAVRGLIASGAVTVDGLRVTDASKEVTPHAEVGLQGVLVPWPGLRYIMLHKPAGVVSATEDAQATVLDLLPKTVARELFPIGRLDKDTEGLLILTNDGAYAHALTAPKKHVPKLYRAAVSGQVAEDTVAAFTQGITLSDFIAQPAALVIVGPWQHTGWTEVTVEVCEGKYHQIKRMFQTCGAQVEYLRRERIGGLMLDMTLQPGDWRDMTKAEVDSARGEGGT